MAKPLFHEGFKCAFFYWIKLFFSRLVSTPSRSCRSPKQFVSTPSSSRRLLPLPKQFVFAPSRSRSSSYPRPLVASARHPLPQAVRFRSLPQPSPAAAPQAVRFSCHAISRCSYRRLLLPLLRCSPLAVIACCRSPKPFASSLICCPSTQYLVCRCYAAHLRSISLAAALLLLHTFFYCHSST